MPAMMIALAIARFVVDVIGVAAILLGAFLFGVVYVSAKAEPAIREARDE